MTDHDFSNDSQAIDLTDELLIAGINEQPEHLAIIINRYQAPLSRYIFRLVV